MKRKNPLLVVSLKQHEFLRIGEDEIEYKGKMYDVVKEVKKGNVSDFYIYHDTDEDQILFNLKNHEAYPGNQTSKNANFPGKLNLKMIDKNFSASKFKLNYQPSANLRQFNLTDEKLVSCFFLNYPTPPPWLKTVFLTV